MNRQRSNGHWMSDEFYASHATADEIRAILGPNLAICRKTVANLARYGNCRSMREYQAAQRLALANREIVS